MLMSRSYKKHAIISITTASSEKKDKQQYNRRFRRATKQLLHIHPHTDVLPHLYDYSNPWCMGKDGKMRIDPTQFPKALRK